MGAIELYAFKGFLLPQRQFVTRIRLYYSVSKRKNPWCQLNMCKGAVRPNCICVTLSRVNIRDSE